MKINPPVSKEAMHLIYTAVDGARTIFNRGRQIAPMVLFRKHGKVGIMAVSQFDNGKDKDVVAVVLGQLRQDSDAVAFVSEVWLRQTADPNDIKLPSTDPKRTEAVNVCVYVRERTLCIMADITRHPDRLGPFEVRIDTANPDTGRPLGGRFIDTAPVHPVTDLIIIRPFNPKR